MANTLTIESTNDVLFSTGLTDKKFKKNIFLITLILIGLSLPIFAQQKKLTSQEFFAPIHVAGDIIFKTSRREKMTRKVYSGSDLKYTEIEIKEFIVPDKEHHISIKEENGKTEKSELIKIGNTFYHRKDGDNWTKEKNMKLPISFFGIPVPISEEFSVEDTKINNKPAKLYRWLAIYYQDQIKKSEENKYYSENKYWINNQGFRVKEEFTTGKFKPKTITSHRLYEYEYNPKDLKIEAPFIGKSNAGKIIENSELDEIKAKAESLLDGLSYRKEEITEVYSKDDSKLLQKISKVYELLPPERFYYSEIEEKGGKTKKTEFVRIYDMRFERINGGKWKSYSQKNSDSLAMKVTKKQKETQFLGTEKLGEKTARVYEVLEKYTSSVKGEVESSKKYWFDENGYLLKSYMEENVVKDSSITKILEKYDYDAKIIIEAPEEAGIDNQ
jgi:hypothetical protein